MNVIFETIGYKNSSGHKLLSRKYSIFLRFMAKNDVKFLNQSKTLTSFLFMQRKKDGIFFP